MPALLDLFKHKPSVAEVSQTLQQYPISNQLRDTFAEHLTTAPNYQLYRFNPVYIAQTFDLSRRVALELLGAAMLSGYLDLNWEVQCPACKGVDIAFHNLRQAQSQMVCGMCSNEFHAHLDDEVHVTFTANQRLRSVSAKDDQPQWRAEIDQKWEATNSHQLLTIQLFRDLFVNEPLPEGESFQIRHLALMFTDLGGSTELYARQGDPRAYGLVREHFNILFDTVAANGGAVVKTIGDAIMAVFPRSDLAIRAAVAAQHNIEEYNQYRSLEHPDRLRLKVGVHCGPALAVTLNERLDYFGTVVNAAARVQAHAGHGETIITSVALADSKNADLAELLDFDIAPEYITLRGLENTEYQVIRVAHEFEQVAA